MQNQNKHGRTTIHCHIAYQLNAKYYNSVMSNGSVNVCEMDLLCGYRKLGKEI